MKSFDEEMMEKLRQHLDMFYSSVELSLVIAKGSAQWLPVYLLAEHSHLPPDNVFKALFDSAKALIISGRIDKNTWDDHAQKIQGTGQLTVPLDNGNSVAVYFDGWSHIDTRFSTGLLARLGWNRPWPHFITNLKGSPQGYESGLWSAMENAAKTHVVPYSSFSEAVSDILHAREDSLEFRTHGSLNGSIIYPLFAAFDSVKYDQSGQKVSMVATVVLHSKEHQEKVCASARLETRDKKVVRIKKTSMANAKAVEDKQGFRRLEWQSALDLSAASIHDARVHLVYELMDGSPLLIDEEHLQSVPALTAESEIKRLMESRSDRRQLDYWLKIEKLLLDEKGEKFEEGVFRLLARSGFDVAWESKNSPIDILATSPYGCLVVECTSDKPSEAMAQELKEWTQHYKSEGNPHVVPVLVTNQIVLSDLDPRLLNMQQEDRVCFLTRDRLRQLLEEAKHESVIQTGRCLQRYFPW